MMTRWMMTAVLAAVCGLTGCGGAGNGEASRAAATDPSVAASSGAAQDSLRDYRYCEILLIRGVADNLRGDVYNTVGLNDCPAEQWAALDADEIAREYRARQAELNGPRYFTMDHNEVQSMGPVVMFDSLAMRRVGQIELPPGSALGDAQQEPYVPHTVDRDTRYVFLAGRPVYQLVWHDSATYVMQSYSRIVDSTLAYADLDSLGARLKLPSGWSYRVVTPDSNLTVASNGQAHILQDDLLNTYQRLDP